MLLFSLQKILYNVIMKKKIGIFLLIIVFFIIKVFLGGFNFYHFFEELIPNIIVLLIVSIILMVVPLIFRLKNKKELDNKKGNIVCLVNSIVIFICFSIPQVITIIKGKHDYMSSIDPVSFSKQLIVIYLLLTIIYYFINKCFFVKSKEN